VETVAAVGEQIVVNRSRSSGAGEGPRSGFAGPGVESPSRSRSLVPPRVTSDRPGRRLYPWSSDPLLGPSPARNSGPYSPRLLAYSGNRLHDDTAALIACYVPDERVHPPTRTLSEPERSARIGRPLVMRSTGSGWRRSALMDPDVRAGRALKWSRLPGGEQIAPVVGAGTPLSHGTHPRLSLQFGQLTQARRPRSACGSSGSNGRLRAGEHPPRQVVVQALLLRVETEYSRSYAASSPRMTSIGSQSDRGGQDLGLSLPLVREVDGKSTSEGCRREWGLCGAMKQNLGMLLAGQGGAEVTAGRRPFDGLRRVTRAGPPPAPPAAVSWASRRSRNAAGDSRAV